MQVSSNDPALTAVDLSNSAVFQLRSEELSQALAEALAKNTHVREVILVNCGINDRACTSLGSALVSNKSIVVLNLEKNAITGAGGSALAGALARNTCMREVNLMNQGSGRWTDRCLDDFLEMFQSNVTLLKVRVCVSVSE